jgi:predicted nucleotidyltransferase
MFHTARNPTQPEGEELPPPVEIIAGLLEKEREILGIIEELDELGNNSEDTPMDKHVRDLVAKIKEHAVRTYSKGIKAVILYGSHARGRPDRDSDVDVLVVVDDALDPSEVRRDLGDILLDVLLEDGELISVIVVPESFYRAYKSPFILNVKREGVTV